MMGIDRLASSRAAKRFGLAFARRARAAFASGDAGDRIYEGWYRDPDGACHFDWLKPSLDFGR